MKFFTKKLGLVAMTFFCLLCASFVVSAQRTITGLVKDGQTGEPLIGANVIVKEEPTKGTVTDLDGRFSLAVGKNATTLMVSYTGFETVEQNIVGQNDVTITLGDSKTLQDVLIIGYGTVKREDATGLVQSVNSESFNKGAIASPQQLIAGKLAGVVVTANDGAPGGGSQIRVRGESSISAAREPLIVIDGVPLDNAKNGANEGVGVSGSRNQLNILNPNDIESITVLKDASSAAIYGNRASAGVILITTKKGKLGKKVNVSYSGNISMAYPTRRVDNLDADEYRDVVRSLKNPADSTKPHPAIALLGNANTNWQDEIFQNGAGREDNLSISGGIWNIPYRVSGGYSNQDGIVKTDNFRRHSLGVNLSPQFLKNRLQFNLNFKAINSKNRFADRGAIGTALYIDPTQPVRDTSAKYGGYFTWKIPNGNPNNLAPRNPVAMLDLRQDRSEVMHYIASGAIDYRFKKIPALRANLNLALDKAHGEGTVVVPNYASFAFDAITGGGTNNYYEQTLTNSLLETYVNYKKSFGVHDFDAMTGYSWQHFEGDNYSKNSDSQATPSETEEFRDPYEYFLISNYARLNYGFRNRLLLTGSIRRDGTSRFGPDFRYGLFTATAIAYKVIDNDNRYLNSLKVRTSYGHTGQQDLGSALDNKYYPYLAQYQLGQNNAQYQFADSFYNTYRPNAYVANIKWEEADAYNVGVDFSIVKDRVSGSFDLYQRNVKDLLNYVPFSALSNLSNFGTRNIGKMESKGFEFALNLMPIEMKNFAWELNTNFAVNFSEITLLTTSSDSTYKGVATGGISGGVGSNIQIHSVGYAPATFFVFEQKYGPNGEFLEGQFVDRNNDGVVNEDDKYRKGLSSPRYTIGLSNTFYVGNFSLSCAARANLGQSVYNNVLTDQGYLARIYGSSGYLANVTQSALDLNAQTQGGLTFSDHFVKRADFLRFDHITAGYDFTKCLDRAFRLSVSVQNPFVFTKYEGIDPELNNGIDNNIYPRPRTYSLGFSLSL